MPGQLDPAVRALVDEINNDPITYNNASADDLRAVSATWLSRLQPNPAPPFEGIVRDDVLFVKHGSVPVRRYQPDDVADAGSVVVHLHGGGWILGSLDSADRFARALAAQMAVSVVSVDYRLSDEAPFPAALLDTLGVVRAVQQEGATWIGLTGDSAGGNLAAAASLTLLREGNPINAQLLVYPCLDPHMSTPSYKQFAEGYLLTAEAMAFYWQNYAAGTNLDDERLAPIAAPSLAGMPDTVIATAEFDPLVDEGADFAHRLINAGVRTTYLPSIGLVHGFIDFTDRSTAALAARDALVSAFADVHRAQLAAR